MGTETDWEANDGKKVSLADMNKWLEEVEYATTAARNAASAAYGSDEKFKQCRVAATAKRYFWNGASWEQYGSAGGGEIGFSGEFSGANPITIPHGLGTTPSFVSVTPKALQPYAFSYNADDTNIIVYHNAAGSLTVSVIAGV